VLFNVLKLLKKKQIWRFHQTSKSKKCFSFRGALLHEPPDQGLCPWTPLGALLTLCTRHGPLCQILNMPLFTSISGQLLQRLQAIQNAADRLITGARRSQHVTPILHQLHWLPIWQRILFNTAILVYKCRHGMAPSYGLTCWHTVSQRHHMTVSVTFALPYLDYYLFHTRPRTTVTAASLLAVRSCGTVCQLHFD